MCVARREGLNSRGKKHERSVAYGDVADGAQAAVEGAGGDDGRRVVFAQVVPDAAADEDAEHEADEQEEEQPAAAEGKQFHRRHLHGLCSGTREYINLNLQYSIIVHVLYIQHTYYDALTNEERFSTGSARANVQAEHKHIL